MHVLRWQVYLHRMDMHALARTLREMRLQAGLKQEELAAQLLISQGHVSAVELGKSKPPTELVDLWAKACGYELRVAFARNGDDDLAHRLALVQHRFSDEERAAVGALLGLLEKKDP